MLGGNAILINYEKPLDAAALTPIPLSYPRA